MGTDYSKLVFVVGVVRSGTSLLYSIINQHPSIALMYECDVWSFPSALSNQRLKGDWLARQEFYNNALSRHRLIFGGSMKGLEKVKTPEDLYSAYSSVKDAPYYGEKSPFYSFRLEELANRYPGCSFILIWRDPVEICQSVTSAGKRSRFFRRRGMVSRLIYYQEEMIRQSRNLKRDGHRVHHLTYNELVAKPEKVCRGICSFLNLEFDEKMLDLTDADFSPIYHEEHHEHLRKGSIERRERAREIVPEHKVQKLRRFQARWARLTTPWIHYPGPAPETKEPGVFERAYHHVAGRYLQALDASKRVMFEFLPMAWLKNYRQIKRWYLNAEDARVDKTSNGLFKQFKSKWQPILLSYLLLAGVCYADAVTGPVIVLGPFYLIPLISMTYLVNRRWGAQIALACAFSITYIQAMEMTVFSGWALVAWNSFMRFLFFEIVVLLLDRVRLEYLRSPEVRDGVDAPLN